MRRGKLRVGTSGWQYDHWRGLFYPPELPKSRWFERYAAEFDTVEVNNTFYRLPSAEVFARWREQAPRGFLYAVKMSRYATHLKHLRDPVEPLARFLERAAELGNSFGPVLVQLPPGWKADAARLDAFLAAAPRERRWAVEVRDPSWLCDDIYAVLRRHRAALVVHDRIERHPEVVTARFSYRRFHGNVAGGRYGRARLSSVARRIAGELERGVDCYAYFNNDAGGHALTDARALLDLLADFRRGRSYPRHSTAAT